jgi:hypothetical protein
LLNSTEVGSSDGIRLQAHLIGLAKGSAFLAAMGLLIAKLNIHMAIHALGIALAALLAVVSCNAFLRDRRPKIFLLTIAFLLLGVQQVMESLDSLGFAVMNTPLPFVGIELLHAVSFGAVFFLAAGVLKKA